MAEQRAEGVGERERERERDWEKQIKLTKMIHRVTYSRVGGLGQGLGGGRIKT